MEIKCPNCGQTCEADEEPAIGQHLLCPFCDMKFNYTPQNTTENDSNSIANTAEPNAEVPPAKIQAKCPHCGAVYEVDAAYIGETATCGTCNRPFVIKAAQETQSPDAPVDAASEKAAQTTPGATNGHIAAKSGRIRINTLRTKAKAPANAAKDKLVALRQRGGNSKLKLVISGIAALLTANLVVAVLFYFNNGAGDELKNLNSDGDGIVQDTRKAIETSSQTNQIHSTGAITTESSPDSCKATIVLPSGAPSELLLKYAELGETDYVRAVLEQNPTLDVNRPRATGNKTALYLACEKGFSDIVELLLKKNADATICDSIRQGFNVQCYSPFTIAAKNGHRSVCQILLASGKVDIESRDTENRTALYAAAANNQASVVQFLCESKAKVNIHGRGGFTPLTVAAFDGHVEVIKTLLKYGRELDLEMRDKGTFNATPLYHAAFKNHPEVVKVLCKAKAKVNIHESSVRGNTPLTAAASQGYVEVVKSLLKYGDGLNLEMKDGLMSYTPLYFAASNNHLEIVEILCKAGADVNAICGVLRETPLGTARRRGYTEVVKILEHYR